MVSLYDNRGGVFGRGRVEVVYAEGVTTCGPSTTEVVHSTMVLGVVLGGSWPNRRTHIPESWCAT